MDNNGFANKNDGASYGNGSGNVNSYGSGSGNSNSYNNGNGYNGGNGYNNNGGGYNNNGNSYNSGNGYSTADNSYVGKFGYRGNSQFAPLSAWGYLGYSLLFSIPLVGLICAIVFACSDKNINRRSFARSFLLLSVIGFVLALIISLIAAAGMSGYAAYMADLLD